MEISIFTIFKNMTITNFPNFRKKSGISSNFQSMESCFLHFQIFKNIYYPRNRIKPDQLSNPTYSYYPLIKSFTFLA